MQDHRLKRRNGAAVDPAAIEQFAKDFRGALIQPRDPTYDQARRIWNASIDKHPGLIARCSGTADVVHAVKFARAHDLLVAVRGGGHNVGGRALCDDGIVIDLSAMKGVFVDPRARTVRVQGGATLGGLPLAKNLWRDDLAAGGKVPIFGESFLKLIDDRTFELESQVVPAVQVFVANIHPAQEASAAVDDHNFAMISKVDRRSPAQQCQREEIGNFAAGFDLSTHRRNFMDAVWTATLQADKGPGQWYVDADSLRYSFFDKVADDDE